MSGVEVLAVLSCVGAIVSAFHGGSELLLHIKEKRKAKKALRDAQTEYLEDSLARGPPVVQGEYDQDFRRFGEQFAIGDRIATDALKDIIITLQMTLLQNLQLAWRQDTMVDFTVLQNASEDSRVNSVVALGQLYQRLAAAAPIPRITTGFTPVPRAIENSRPMMPTWGPPPVPPTARRSVPLEPEIRPPEKKSPAAKLSLFRRPKSDTAVPNRTSQEPIVPHYLLPAITADKSDPGWLLKEVEYRDKDVARVSMSSTEISSDASSSIFEPNDLWQNRRGISDGSIQDTATEASLSPISSRPRVPTSTLEVATSTPPRLTLPCEENKFAGFCKGAWKMQSGIKKAITERQRPGGMYSANLYWRCQKCMFEGRMTADKGTKRKSYDTQVHNTNGIQWRWLFLFKSHVYLNDILQNPQASTFGCIFCCGVGKGTPMFGGVQSFMNHLQQHRDSPPSGEVLYKMNCIVGRVADVREDFDINLPPPGEGGA